MSIFSDILFIYFINSNFSNMNINPVFKKVLKRLGILFGLFVLFVLIFGVLLEPAKRKLGQWQEKKMIQEAEKQQKEIEQMYKNDTIGGKTPEETFDMFLDALKKGNIDLASKYYELSVQPKAFAGLKEELQKEGNLEKSIKYFTDVRGGEKVCHDLDNSERAGCNFEYTYITSETSTSTMTISRQNIVLVTPKGSESNKITDLELNHYTQTWKITQPY